MSDLSPVVARHLKASDRELALALVEAVNIVHEASRRAARLQSSGHRTQPEIGLARLLRATPGLSVREAAEQLGLAPNTVSTLVSTLVSDGWLERRPDEQDRRVARLFLSELGRSRMQAWRESRLDAIDQAMAATTTQLGFDRVRDALGVIDVLAAELERVQQAQSPTPDEPDEA